MMKKLTIFVLVVVILGGLGYVVFMNKETQQDPKLLIGLWKTESSIFPDGEYLEMKETEFCFAWSGDSPEHFRCSQYAPYTVSKNLLGFGEQSQPNIVFEVADNALTVWQYGEKKVYERVGNR